MSTAASSSPARPAVGFLQDAHVVLDHPGAIPSGSWPRAVALLGRLALERGLVDLWAAVEPTMGAVRNKRAQFICLRSYVEPDVAHSTHYAWTMLSEACHHHVYDLPPTETELRRWLETTDRFLHAVGDAMQPGRQR